MYKHNTKTTTFNCFCSGLLNPSCST